MICLHNCMYSAAFIPGIKSASNFYQKIRKTLYTYTLRLRIFFYTHSQRKLLRFSPLSIPIPVRTRNFFYFAGNSPPDIEDDCGLQPPVINTIWAENHPLLCFLLRWYSFLWNTWFCEIRVYYKQAQHKVHGWQILFCFVNFLAKIKIFLFSQFYWESFTIFCTFFCENAK